MKLLLFTATFAVYSIAFAQKQIFRYEPPYGGHISTSLLNDDKTNSLYFVVVHRDFIERIRLTQRGRENLLHQGTLPNETFVRNYELDEKTHRLFSDNKYTDICVNGTEMIELLQHQWIHTDLIFVETNLANGQSVSTDTVRMQQAGDLLFTYRKAKALCLVEKPKNKSYFLVHRKVFGRSVKTDTAQNRAAGYRPN